MSLVADAGAPTSPSVGRAFRALLWRDVFVTGRELVPFLLQVVLQPVFLLFVFGKVLVELGFATSEYSDVLLPGVIALTAFLTALNQVANGALNPVFLRFVRTRSGINPRIASRRIRFVYPWPTIESRGSEKTNSTSL
jgi:hypothetical protein